MLNKLKSCFAGKKIILLLTSIGFSFNVWAIGLSDLLLKSSQRSTVAKNKPGEKYWTSDDDGMIFSWAKTPGYQSKLRLSMFFNVGAIYNYNITSNVALISGVTLRNIGFTNQLVDTIYKARNYYAGIPLGLRIGNLKKKTEILIGGGMDFGFASKNKQWTEGDKKATKQKYYCWFDSATNNIMPYVYAGFRVKGIGIKYTYQLQPYYKNGNSNIMFISLLLNASNKNKGNINKVKKIRKSNNTI